MIDTSYILHLRQPFIDSIGKAYQEKVGHEAEFYVVDIGDGARKLEQ